MNVHFNHYTRVCVFGLGLLVFTPGEARVVVGHPGVRSVAPSRGVYIVNDRLDHVVRQDVLRTYSRNEVRAGDRRDREYRRGREYRTHRRVFRQKNPTYLSNSSSKPKNRMSLMR